MARPTEPDELKTLKGIIRFAKGERISKFKYNGWEFDLLGSDPTEERFYDLEQNVKDLQSTVKHLAMKLEFKPKVPR